MNRETESTNLDERPAPDLLCAAIGQNKLASVKEIVFQLAIPSPTGRVYFLGGLFKEQA